MFRRWLARLYFENEGAAPGGQGLTDAVGVLEGAALFDGADHEVKGASDAKTTRVYTRVDDHHYSYATKVNGLITTTSRVAVTPDGKTRTMTVSGRDAEGRVIRNFVVFNRQ